MTISLLMGNGVNRLTNAEASWEHVLRALTPKRPSGKDLDHFKHKPFALLYEEILLAGPSADKPADELVMKQRIAELVGNLKSNDIHRRIMASNVMHVMTTNYDYGFEIASGERMVRRNLVRETKYSVYRRRAVGEKYVWHVHGEAETPNSITLGYDQYSGYLQKLRGHATADRESGNASPFKLGDNAFDTTPHAIYSWLDVFLRDDIHIVGLGLDYTEIDLWWAITYKARLKARRFPVGTTFFHDWYSEEPNDEALAKHSLLKALAVEVRLRDCRRGFEPAYDDFIRTTLNA